MLSVVGAMWVGLTSNIKPGISALSVCMYVLHIPREPFIPIYVTLGRCVAKDPSKCSVKFGTIQTQDTFNIQHLEF